MISNIWPIKKEKNQYLWARIFNNGKNQSIRKRMIRKTVNFIIVLYPLISSNVVDNEIKEIINYW